MSVVGAYIELKPGETPPEGEPFLVQEMEFLEKTSEGIVVASGYPEPPEGAQYYLYWVPKVIATWVEEQEEIENGEAGEDADGSDVEQRDEEVPAEPDLGVGEGGAGDGDLPAAGDEGQPEETE